MSRRLTTDEFIAKSKKIHNETYSYEHTSYTSTRKKVSITCKIHGIFEQTGASHLSGRGCNKCAQEIRNKKRKGSTTDEFIKKCKKIHGEKYSYKNTVYKNRRSKVAIECKEHGVFMQLARSHLNGHGCAICMRGLGEYSETSFDLYPERKQLNGLLYVVRLNDENESFIKIGITKRDIKLRFGKIISSGYDLEMIHELDMNLYDAFKLEQLLLMEVNKFQYTPLKSFGGWTECLEDSHIVLEEIEKYLDVNPIT